MKQLLDTQEFVRATMAEIDRQVADDVSDEAWDETFVPSVNAARFALESALWDDVQRGLGSA